MMRPDSSRGVDRIAWLGAERHAGIDTGAIQLSRCVHRVFVYGVCQLVTSSLGSPNGFKAHSVAFWAGKTVKIGNRMAIFNL